MSGDDFGPPSRRAWQVRTPRLRPACRRLSEQDGSERQAACHQRYLDDRRSRSPGDICRLRNARSLRSYVRRAQECGRSPGRWSGRRRRSRGSCGAMPRRAAGAWTIVQPQRSGMPTGRSGAETSEAGGQPGAAHVCAGSVGRRGRHAKGHCNCRAFGILERSSTRTSAGSAMGIGMESGADYSSPTARLSPR